MCSRISYFVARRCNPPELRWIPAFAGMTEWDDPVPRTGWQQLL